MLGSIKSAALATVILVASALSAEEPQVHYLGFNLFGPDKIGSGRVFDAYMKKLQPIMARYGVTAEPYTVLNGGSKMLSADVITFGTAKDQASFQAFFQDAALQEIFPMLVGALDGHQVIFTAGPFSPSVQEEQNHLLLSANWLKGAAGASLAKLSSITENATQIFGKYGAFIEARATGVFSNQGLTGEIKKTVPPHLLEVRSIRDAHGLFDDPLMIDANMAAKKLLSRTENFWIIKRDFADHNHK